MSTPNRAINLPPGTVTGVIRSRMGELQRSEQLVAVYVLEHPATVVNLTVNQLATTVGVSRATAIRTCQSLGYGGYQQLRINLAKEVGGRALQPPQNDGTAVGTVRADIALSVAALSAVGDHLDGAAVEAAVAAVANAKSVLLAGSGLSGPVADDFSMRLSALGILTQRSVDPLAQEIAALSLDRYSVCVVFSSSGRNSASFAVANAAKSRGVQVILITAVSESPLREIADVVLDIAIPGMADPTGIREIGRLPAYLLGQALATAVGTTRSSSAEVVRRVYDTVNAFALHTPLARD